MGLLGAVAELAPQAPKATREWPEYWRIVYPRPSWLDKRQRCGLQPCRFAELSVDQIAELVRREIEDHTGPAADGEQAPIWRVG